MVAYLCFYLSHSLLQLSLLTAVAAATFTVQSVSLTGGSSTPTIARSTRRTHNSNQLFHPIDYQYMNTAGAKHPVEVIVNSIPAVCSAANGECGYEFLDMGKITALSNTGSTASLTLSDPTSVGFTSSDVFVTIAGQHCAVDTSSASVAPVTCAMA